MANPTKNSNGFIAGSETVMPNNVVLLIGADGKAMYFVPRTQAQRDSIVSPIEGMILYQSDANKGFYYYNGTEWVALGGGSGIQSIIPGNEFTLVDSTDPQNPVVTAAQNLTSVLQNGNSTDYSAIFVSNNNSITISPVDGTINVGDGNYFSRVFADRFNIEDSDGYTTAYKAKKIEFLNSDGFLFSQNFPLGITADLNWSYPTDETTATNASREWVLENAGPTTTITGTTGEVDVAQPNPGEYVIGLPESVSVEELTVQGNLVVNGNPDFYGTPYFEQIPNFFAGVNPAQINQDATHRFATDAEKSTWNGKQDAIGYTPENQANKQNSLAADGTNTKYPTVSAVNTGLATKEPAITATTAADYFAGDKTFKPLNKAAVGLGNVDNTSDANKPVSTAQQTALNAKQDNLVSGTNIKTVGGESLLGSGNVKTLVPILRDYNTYTGTAIATQQHLVSYPIQLNIDANGWIDIELEKSGTAGTMRIELWLGNTAGTMVGAQQIAVYTVAAGSRYLYQLHRSFRIDASGLARFRGPAQNMVTDAAVGTQADQVRNLTTTPPVQYLQVWATMQTAATDIPSVVEAVVVITK